MRRRLVTALLATAVFGICSTSRAVLVMGDFAVIRVNNSTDSFSYVALKAIPANEFYTWTDSSWNSANGAWRTSENSNSAGALTSASAIPAGTIFNFTVAGGGLNNGGEQLFLYSGDFTASSTNATAKFVYGVNWDNAGWQTTGPVGSTSESYMPSTLSGASVAARHGRRLVLQRDHVGNAGAIARCHQHRVELGDRVDVGDDVRWGSIGGDLVLGNVGRARTVGNVVRWRR